MNRDALTEALEAARAKLDAALEGLNAEELTAPGTIGDWSIKDLLAHFIAHEQFALSELAAARRGETYRNPFQDSDEMNAAALFTEELNQRCSKRYAYRKDQPRIANALLPDLGKPVPHAPGEFVRRVEAKLGLEQQAKLERVCRRRLPSPGHRRLQLSTGQI